MRCQQMELAGLLCLRRQTNGGTSSSPGEGLPIWRGASCAEGPSAAAKGGRSNGTGIEGSSQVGKRALIRRVCAYAFGVL